MSIASSLDGRGLAKRLQRLRQKRYIAYGFALAAVAIATVIRAAADTYLGGGRCVCYLLRSRRRCHSAGRILAWHPCCAPLGPSCMVSVSSAFA